MYLQSVITPSGNLQHIFAIYYLLFTICYLLFAIYYLLFDIAPYYRGWVQYPNGQYRGILYRTINGGINWFFQIPDTTIHIASYEFINFANKRHGWVYSNYPTYVTGIHTTTGGNDTFYTGLQQIGSKIPERFKLFQNYPNPFNPKTIINYELRITSYVTLSVFEITGKKVIDLVNQKQSEGRYQVDFSGNGLSSGIYFYSLYAEGELVDTKKMILIK